MKIFRIVAGIGFLILLLALTMPWLTINFMGQFNFSLADIYSAIFRGSSSSSQSVQAPSQITSQYLPSIGAMVATILLYPLAIVLAALGMLSRKVSLVSGILGILLGFLWIFGVDSLKSLLVQEAARQGGLFGQLIGGAIASLISVGYGVYAAIVGGVVLVLAFFSEKHKVVEVEAEPPPAPPTLFLDFIVFSYLVR